MSQPWQVRLNEGIARFRARWMVDMDGISSRIQNYIISRLTIEPMVLEPDLASSRSWRAFGMASVTTSGVWSDRFRKIILSHYAIGPTRHGLYVVLLPQRGMDHPCFFAELAAYPEELAASIDVYSPRFSDADYALRYGAPLGEARQAHLHLGGLEAPLPWTAGLRSEHGLALRLPCENIEAVVAALFDYLDRYLDLVLETPPLKGLIPDPDAEARSERTVTAFTASLRSNAAVRHSFERLFGSDWTARYAALVLGP